MKFKNLLIFIIFVFSVVLVGCQPEQKEVYDINDVKEVLNNYNNSTDVDMNYTIEIKTFASITINSRMVIKTINEKQIIFMEMGDLTGKINMYYIDGYVCTENNGEYFVMQSPDFADENNNPLPTDLNFDELTYELVTNETETEVIYLVDINDNDVKSFVEKMMGQELPSLNMTIQMKLELTVDKATKQLKSMKINISLTESGQTVKLEMLATINAFGEAVKLEVPNVIYEEIEKFKNDENQLPEPQI